MRCAACRRTVGTGAFPYGVSCVLCVWFAEGLVDLSAHRTTYVLACARACVYVCVSVRACERVSHIEFTRRATRRDCDQFTLSIRTDRIATSSYAVNSGHPRECDKKRSVVGQRAHWIIAARPAKDYHTNTHTHILSPTHKHSVISLSKPLPVRRMVICEKIANLRYDHALSRRRRRFQR